MARGHKIDKVPEIPLVISDDLSTVDKTKKAMAALDKFGAADDVRKAKASRNIRRGKGKMRNRRYTMRRGPLIIYSDETDGVRFQEARFGVWDVQQALGLEVGVQNASAHGAQ